MRTTDSNYLLLTAAIANAATFKTAQFAVKAVWGQVVKWLSPNFPGPQIYQYFSRDGEIYWAGFDPYTNSFVNGVSESEIRVWLEKQYH